MPQERKNEIWRTNSGFQIADDKLGRVLRDWILSGVPMDRFPTEAEWEYAARAGSRTRFHSGEKTGDLNRVAIWNTNSTRPVGTKEANAFGLHDVHGNVWEWIADWWDSKSFSNSSTPLIDPVGSENGNSRVLRGGSWFSNYDEDLQSACRRSFNPDDRDRNFGFRLVRT